MNTCRTLALGCFMLCASILCHYGVAARGQEEFALIAFWLLGCGLSILKF
jgi:hypothetical protein